VIDLFPEVKPHLGNEDENQRYTTDEADAWCRSVAGVEAWDLDVAACAMSHRASKWYGLPLDGKTLPWFGRVFCNPPWDDIEPWVVSAWTAFADAAKRAQVVAMLLPGNRTHRPWWQTWVEPFRDGRDIHGEGWPLAAAPLIGQPGPKLTVHFAPKRFAYGGPGNVRGVGVSEPNFTSVLLLWRRA
jgi:hypothetical protein